ncbi:hypothetical protein VC83_04455 [Pseudogymnoascus destructans]|uniref:Uncharacterized protein n=1 Tax=Pseudogymnoascus destructans TaxID=655981 RepID=A0A177ACA0_9PEZI|nr:uncharacterized protein VC83_04455 [Pseudogymnoascus destructans]OAF59420.1 hypothetical protein VC83_04455 [Pseudogymnoascus destructans]
MTYELPEVKLFRIDTDTHPRQYVEKADIKHTPSKFNPTWTSLGDDDIEPDLEAQASAFFHLAQGIEDAMDEIPDNNRILRKPQDELVIVDTNVQMPICVNKQKIEVGSTVMYAMSPQKSLWRDCVTLAFKVARER